MTTRSVLITGASGFVGRALTARLVRDGRAVTCVGRRDPGVPGARFRPVQRLDGAGLEVALDGMRFDSVFHLAAYGVSPHDRDPVAAFDVNVAGTVAVVQAAVAGGAGAIVYTGSCAEYEAAAVGIPVAEDHRLTTLGLYGATKAAAGFAGQAIARHRGLPFVWLRLFGVYGGGEAPHRLLPSIASRLARGLPADLSLGDQMRDMLHVSEAVDGLLAAERAARSDRLGPYNLCSGRAISVRKFACAVADALGKPRDLLRFGALPYRPGENMWLVGCGEALARAGEFRSRLSLEEGLARSLEQPAGGAGRDG